MRGRKGLKTRLRGGAAAHAAGVALVFSLLAIWVLEAASAFWDYTRAVTVAQLAARAGAGAVDVQHKEWTGEVRLLRGPAERYALQVVEDNLQGIEHAASVSFLSLPTREQCARSRSPECQVLDMYPVLPLEIQDAIEVEVQLLHRFVILPFSPVWIRARSVSVPQVAH